MAGSLFRDGETVELRVVEDEDVAFITDLLNDPRVRVDTATVGPKYATEIRDWVDSRGEGGDADFVVCVDGEPVGVISLSSPNEAWGTMDVGYSIRPAEWGNGYATNALEEACGYAFDERRMHKVYATTYAGNDASNRVLEKAGFTREGVLREEGFGEGKQVDVYRYGLLADEWRDDYPVQPRES